MTRVLATVTLFAAASFAMVGCGGSSGPTNITEGASMSDFEKYEAMVAESEKAMGANADPGTKGATEATATPETEAPAEQPAAE